MSSTHTQALQSDILSPLVLVVYFRKQKYQACIESEEVDRARVGSARGADDAERGRIDTRAALLPPCAPRASRTPPHKACPAPEICPHLILRARINRLCCSNLMHYR